VVPAAPTIAPELGFQFHKVNEEVGLPPPQFISHHRRLAGIGRDDGNVDAATLHRFQQRAEVPIAREQKHLVDMTGERHRIDGELDIHAALRLAAAAGVDELLGELGNDGIAVIVEPIDEGADR